MRRPFLALVATLAIACPSRDGGPADAGPKGPVSVDEVEPNDSVATAQRLKEPSVVRCALSGSAEKSDEDLFRLEPAGPGKSGSFEVSGIPGCDVALELMDADGNHLALYNSESEGKGERIPALGLTVPLLVKVSAAKKGSGGAYTATFLVAEADPGTEIEPNNRAVDATPLALGAPMKGLVADRADEDWFRFELPAPDGAGAAVPVPDGGAADASPGVAEPIAEGPAVDGGGAAALQPPAVIKLEITGVPEVRLQVEVANAAQAVFYTAKSREIGEGVQVRNLALRPGESSYFAIVKSAWTGAGKDARRGYNGRAPYTLTLSLEEAGANAELEPNDDPDHATPVTGDGPKVGFFAPKGDVDFYAVRYDRPALAKIELAGVDRVDSALSLVKVDADGKEVVLLKANDGGVKEGELLVDVAVGPERTVLVKVEGVPRQVEGKWVRDQENATQPYRLMFTSRPDEGFDEREPNNEPELATPIALKKPMKGHVHPQKDVDYYRLDLTGSPVKVPLKATVSGLLKVDVSLGLHRFGADGQVSLVQRAEKGKADQPETIRYTVEPGVYLLEVRDTKNRESNFLDAYYLTVEQEP